MTPPSPWPPELDRRRAAMRAIVEREGCDVALVFGSQGHAEHFRYLTNFAPLMGDMWLVLGGDDSSACFLDFDWQLEEARRRSGIANWHGGAGPAEHVAGALRERGASRIAVAGLDRLPVTLHDELRERLDGTELVDVGSAVAALRRRKSPLEVELLRAAAASTDAALDAAREELRPGLTERELAARLGYALGAEWAFPPCVISGLDDPIPIREPTERRVEEGDTVLVDIGAAHQGYQADASRTFVLGSPNGEQRRVWDAVRRAYEAALERTRPGVPCVEVQRAAEAAANDAGFSLAHRIGHGIGLATSFEWPSLASEQAALEPGVTICIEPGISLPGAGVMKLEDDVVVTENGFELLTHSSAELEVTW